jgi:hypothetical protein
LKRICLSLIALSMVGLPATTLAGDMVPFFARGVGIGSLGPSTPTEQILNFDISLQATHLGKSTGSATYALKIPELSFTGTFNLEGSNGDMVFFNVTSGQLTQPPNPPNPYVYDFTQSVTVVGGTGKFAGATGELTGTGQFNMLTIIATVTFKGEISRPHSQGG